MFHFTYACNYAFYSRPALGKAELVDLSFSFLQLCLNKPHGLFYVAVEINFATHEIAKDRSLAIDSPLIRGKREYPALITLALLVRLRDELLAEWLIPQIDYILERLLKGERENSAQRIDTRSLML